MKLPLPRLRPLRAEGVRAGRGARARPRPGPSLNPPLRSVARMRELFPDLRVLTIAGADHWVHASAPQAFREAIAAFLRELPAG